VRDRWWIWEEDVEYKVGVEAVYLEYIFWTQKGWAYGSERMISVHSMEGAKG
jgi:hypothetical protein